MKHLKTYENISKGQYWLLPRDDRFEKSLKDIDCNKDFIEILLESDDEDLLGCKYIFIACDDIYKKQDRTLWGWNPFEGNLHDELYDEYGYKFMGTVNIPDYELTANKYNL